MSNFPSRFDRFLDRILPVLLVVLTLATAFMTYTAYQIHQETQRIEAQTRQIEREIDRLEAELDTRRSTPVPPRPTPPPYSKFDEEPDNGLVPPSRWYPYGNLEGEVLTIVIKEGQSVWSSLAAKVNARSYGRLMPHQTDIIVGRLVELTEAKAGRKLDLVYAGQTFSTGLVPRTYIVN